MAQSYSYARTDRFKYSVINRFPVNFDKLPIHVMDTGQPLHFFLSGTKQHFTTDRSCQGCNNILGDLFLPLLQFLNLAIFY